MTGLISVIVPCFQQGRLLPDALSSLIHQTYRNWEALIIDDGSSDETPVVARTFCSLDHRFRYIFQENSGLASARNKGLSISRGELIQFLDADDLILPEKFERHIKAIRTANAPIISYTDYDHVFFESRGSDTLNTAKLRSEIQQQSPLLDLARNWEFELSIPIHCALFPGDVIRNNNIIFDSTLPNHEDWDYWMQILPHIEQTVYIPQRLAIYRIRRDSMSRQSDESMWRGFNMAIDKHLMLNRLDRNMVSALSQLASRNDYMHHKGIRGLANAVSKLNVFRYPIFRRFSPIYRRIFRP